MAIQVDPGALRAAAAAVRPEARRVDPDSSGLPSGLNACYLGGGLFAEVVNMRVAGVVRGVGSRTATAMEGLADALTRTAHDFESVDASLAGGGGGG